MFTERLPISHRETQLLVDRVGIVSKIIELGHKKGVQNGGCGDYIATLSNCVDRVISIELHMADKREDLFGCFYY